MTDRPPDRVRFGAIELDLRSGELCQGDNKLILTEQPFQVLRMLVDRDGKLVTRKEIEDELWSKDTVVEFDRGINVAISKLRKALGDSADEPKYIGTVASRGYRLMVPVERMGPSPDKAPDSTHSERDLVQPTILRVKNGLRNRWTAPVALLVLALAIGSVKALPAIARFYNNRGVQLQRRGQIQEAMSSYERAVNLDSAYAAAHYNLADAYEEISVYDKAVDQYQRAIEADPTFYEAYNNLARLYIQRRKDYEAALSLLDRALSFKPQEPSVQYSLHKNYGWANFELRHWGQAENDLRLAVRLDPNRGAAHCLLAKILDAQGRATDAFHEWEACTAYSSQPEVEPEWRVEAQEQLSKEAPK